MIKLREKYQELNGWKGEKSHSKKTKNFGKRIMRSSCLKVVSS